MGVMNWLNGKAKFYIGGVEFVGGIDFDVSNPYRELIRLVRETKSKQIRKSSYRKTKSQRRRSAR